MPHSYQRRRRGLRPLVARTGRHLPANQPIRRRRQDRRLRLERPPISFHQTRRPAGQDHPGGLRVAGSGPRDYGGARERGGDHRVRDAGSRPPGPHPPDLDRAVRPGCPGRSVADPDLRSRGRARAKSAAAAGVDRAGDDTGAGRTTVLSQRVVHRTFGLV